MKNLKKPTFNQRRVVEAAGLDTKRKFGVEKDTVEELHFRYTDDTSVKYVINKNTLEVR